MRVALVQFSDGWVNKGAGYIAASILREGHELSFFDTYETETRKIVGSIVKNDCELLLLSVMTLDVPYAIDLIRQLNLKKKIPVLVGGIHPTISGAQLLEQYPEIDYLCIGEGESMIVDFIRDFGKPEFNSIPNLAYRKDGKVIVNPLRGPEDLGKLPPFPWHLFDRYRIVDRNGWLSVSTTRGCPYRCTYCCNEKYLDHYGKNYLRKRPIDQVISEMLFLKKEYKPRFIFFNDEMLLWDKKHCKELFLAMKEQLHMPYGFMARVEHITQEIVDIAKETGCQYVGMGIECGDETFRREHLNRNMTNEQIESAFVRLKSAGIFTTSYNMIGFPFAFDDELTKATIELNKKIQPDFVQVTIFYPFPGTELYDQCVESGMIDPSQVKKITSYHDDSILKGVSLKGKPEEISALFDSKRNWKKRWGGIRSWPYIGLRMRAVMTAMRKKL